MRVSLAVLASVVGLVLGAAPASAATPWVGLQPVSAAVPALGPFIPGPGGVQSGLAVAPDGRAVVAWMGNDGTLLASRRAPSGTWSAPERVSPAGTPLIGYTIDVATDAAGDATILWLGGSSVRRLMASSATATGAWQAPVVIDTVGSVDDASQIDVAMNAGGATVAVYGSNSTAGQVSAVSSATPGAAWTAPVVVSNTAAGHGGLNSRVAINASGEALATYVDVSGTSPNFAYYVRAAARPADGAWPANSLAAVGASSGGQPQPVLDDTGRATVVFRDGTQLMIGSRSPGTNVAFEVAASAGSCTSGPTDNAVALALDANRERTLAVACNARVLTARKAAGTSFAGALSSAQDLGAVMTSPTLALDADGDGRAVLAVAADGTSRAYRRGAGAAATFGGGEALADPDVGSTMIPGAGLDPRGDAITLVGVTRSGGGWSSVVDLSASLLDASTPTASISGPATAAPGELVTFTGSFDDPFGGPQGALAWTSSDGPTGAGTTFDRTFGAPGTYKLTFGGKDIAGNAATASKQIVVAVPPPPTTTTTTTTTTPPPVTQPPGQTPPPVVTPKALTCVVPKLAGKSLTAAKTALKKAGCALGRVKKPRRKKGAKAPKLVVSKQSPTAKKVVPRGTKVALTLKAKVRAKTKR